MAANPVRSPCVDFSPVLVRVRGPDADRSGGKFGRGGVSGLVSIKGDEQARGGQHPRENDRVSPGRRASQGDDDRLWKLLGQQQAVEFPLNDDQRLAGSNDSRVGKDERTIGVGFRVPRLAIVQTTDLDPGQPGAVPPGNDDPGEQKAAVPSPSRDRDGGREPVAARIVSSVRPRPCSNASGSGLQVPRGSQWPRQRGLMLRPRASRTVALATGWRLAGDGGRSAAGQLVPIEGGITPDRSARNLTAAGKSHWLILLTSSAASPPTAHAQHRQVFRVRSTWKLGSWSSMERTRPE